MGSISESSSLTAQLMAGNTISTGSKWTKRTGEH